MEWGWNGVGWDRVELDGMEWNGVQWNRMEWNGTKWNGTEWNGGGMAVEYDGMECKGERKQWTEQQRKRWENGAESVRSLFSLFVFVSFRMNG